MTRRVAMRILGVSALSIAAVCALLPWLYSAFLPLDHDGAMQAWRASGLIGLTLLLAEGVTLGWGLRRVPSPLVVDATARRAVIALPMRVGALAALGGGAGAIAAVGLGVRDSATAAPTLVAMGLCAAAAFGLLALPLFAFSRQQLTPLLLGLGDESPVGGPRLSLRLRLGYAVGAVTAAAIIPAAVFGVERLSVAAADLARERALVTAHRLAYAAEDLDVAAARVLIERSPLSHGARALLHAASGTLLPEDVAIELGGEPFVEVPLVGPLRGAFVRVVYEPLPIPRAPLLVVTFALLGLAMIVAWALGTTVAVDTANIAAQIEHVARGEPPVQLAVGATAEVRRVTLAANRLLERVPRLTMEAFVASEQADEARRMKSQFLANMSHDLRAPLNSILGFSELLLRNLEGAISVGQRVTLAAIHATGLRLLRMLSEILDTAKVEAGKMELHRKVCPPAELLTQAMNEAKKGRDSTIAERVHLALSPGIGPIQVDPLRITQAISHLIGWAMDEAGARPIRLSASASTEWSNPAFVIELEVEGQIDEPALERLFDPFSPAPGRTGLHLALPLARRLFELHGARVEARAGSPIRITITLPTGSGGRA